jgi:heat shock protein HtpX
MGAPFMIARAALAIVLMIGFYALALGMAGGLLWLPYAEVVYAHHITPKLALICIVAGAGILWAAMPRPDKFIAPGPRLRRAEHPRLFEKLETIAQATRQAMPAEVYLVPDVNAWVAQRGGVMGLGSRRVMGLGLPLMRILTCSQLSAVLAHEFGHYHGGDTRIGPWIYKTRSAIGRTLGALGSGSWLQYPFRWYGMLFLRITHTISRRQEYVADELAARAVGARPLIEGLHTVHRVAPAYAFYWHQECAPVLGAGFLPPLADGFDLFVRARPIAEKVDQRLHEELASGVADPYDTHPSLKDRVAALAKLPQGSEPGEDPPAASLLNDVPALERELMAQMAGAEGASLTQISWEDTGARVYIPQWTRLVQAHAAGLKGITPAALPGIAGDIKGLGQSLRALTNQPPDDEGAPALANGVVGAALLLLLIARGGQLHVIPGEDFFVRLDGHEVKPFTVLPALQSGAISAQAWDQQCTALGIAGADLSGVAAPAPDVDG